LVVEELEVIWVPLLLTLLDLLEEHQLFLYHQQLVLSAAVVAEHIQEHWDLHPPEQEVQQDLVVVEADIMANLQIQVELVMGIVDIQVV
jgi:hypothetical protein|tara:strand:- start:416 stop:682 length:267 start_codon:yes stop_codon:yes gene_type:complete